jgi:hypothetical protein
VHVDSTSIFTQFLLGLLPTPQDFLAVTAGSGSSNNIYNLQMLRLFFDFHREGRGDVFRESSWLTFLTTNFQNDEPTYLRVEVCWHNLDYVWSNLVSIGLTFQSSAQRKSTGQTPTQHPQKTASHFTKVFRNALCRDRINGAPTTLDAIHTSN